MTLQTRAPYGGSRWPLILVDGDEFGGALDVALTLSSSELVDRTFVFDASGDTAARGGLGDFEVVEWDGRPWSLERLVPDVVAAPTDGLPHAAIIDGTDLWSKLRSWASERHGMSKASRALLADDPHADLGRIPAQVWDACDDVWWSIIRPLRDWHGIAVVVARVAEDDQGREYVEAKPRFAATVDAWVSCRRPGSVRLIGARGVRVEAGGEEITDPNPLEWVVFDRMDDALDFVDVPRQARDPGPVVGTADELGAADEFAVFDAPEVGDDAATGSAGEDNATGGTTPADQVADVLPDEPEDQTDDDPGGTPALDPATCPHAACRDKGDGRTVCDACGEDVSHLFEGGDG